VQLAPGSEVTADELQQLVGDTLAGYKRVRQVAIVDHIPRTPSGKVLRRTLKDQWSSTLAPAVG
jgi:acyl-coenzyme A synthetase/AMP-(fatty) acid ligase